MKFKILEPSERYGWVFNHDEEPFKAFGLDRWSDPFVCILAKIPGARKKDILDYFAYAIFALCEWFELDGIILGDYGLSDEDKPEISSLSYICGRILRSNGPAIFRGYDRFRHRGWKLK